MSQNQIINILLAIIIIALLYFLLSNKKIMAMPITRKNEHFNIDTGAKLENYYYPISQDISEKLVDKLPSNKKCCGFPDADIYDGLTTEELRETMIEMTKKCPSTKTNYRSLNGYDGVGCPCYNNSIYL